MGKERSVGRRPFKAVKGIKGVKVPAKLRHQDKDTVRAKKFHHHLKLIHKALKKARQFEAGKIKRRLKAAQETDRAKLETQLAALGKVDLDAAARQAAEKCGVAQSPEQHIAATLEPDADAPATSLASALRLLSARLLAAKCVREEVEAAQRDMAALDAAVAAQERRQQQIAQRQTDRAQRKQEAAEGGAARPSAGGHGLDGLVQQSSDDEDSRLGSSSEFDEDAKAQAQKRRLLLSTRGASSGDSDSDEAAMGSSPQQSPAGSGGGGGKVGKAQQPAPPKKPKNRLGQRARRKLAEQAFGGGAKHLAPSDTRPSSTAAQRRTAAAATAVAPVAASLDQLGGSGRGAPHAARVSGRATPAEELHPSWAAKARAKAALSAKPAGKKVVFSDDGDAQPMAYNSGGGPVAPSHPTAARPAPAARVPGVVRHRDRERDRPAAAANGATGSGGKRPAGKLHPSWEAKAKLRKQMESLPAPAGIKVVFADSD